MPQGERQVPPGRSPSVRPDDRTSPDSSCFLRTDRRYEAVGRLENARAERHDAVPMCEACGSVVDKLTTEFESCLCDLCAEIQHYDRITRLVPDQKKVAYPANE